MMSSSRFTLFAFFLLSAAMFHFHSCGPGMVLSEEAPGPHFLTGKQKKNEFSLPSGDPFLQQQISSSAVFPGWNLSDPVCRHCGQALSSGLSSGECAFRSAAFEQDSGKAEDLYKEARRLLTQEAEREGRASSRILLGVMAERGLANGNPDEIAAARHFRLAAESGSPAGMTALAVFWIRRNMELEEAEKLLIRSQSILPDDPDNKFGFAELYFARGKWDGAFSLLRETYAETAPETEERAAAEMMAVNFLQRLSIVGGRDRALAELDFLIRQDPWNALFYAMRASLRKEQGEFESAEKDWNAVLEIGGPRAPVYAERAEVRSASGRLAGALEDMKTAVKLSPLDPELFLRKGMIELEASEYGDAFSSLEEAKRLLPGTDPRLSCFAAMIHLRRKEYRKAEAVLEKLPSSARNGESAALLAEVKRAMKDYAAAVRIQYEIYTRDTFDPVNALRLAESLILAGSTERALEFLPEEYVQMLRTARSPLLPSVLYLKAFSLTLLGRNAHRETRELVEVASSNRNPARRPGGEGRESSASGAGAAVCPVFSGESCRRADSILPEKMFRSTFLPEESLFLNRFLEKFPQKKETLEKLRALSVLWNQCLPEK